MVESKTCDFCYKLIEDNFSIWKVVYIGNHPNGHIQEKDLCKKCFSKIAK